jgi:hypothetical protein
MFKSLLVLSTTIFSLQSFATGSLYCVTPQTEYEIFASTARVFGNPIIGGLLVNNNLTEETQEFLNSQIVGYWNMGDDLKLAVIDEQAMGLQFVIKAKFVSSDNGPTYIGTLELADGSTFKVSCEQ